MRNVHKKIHHCHCTKTVQQSPQKKRYSTPIYAHLYLSSRHNICHHPYLLSRGLPPGTRLLLK